jgi:transcriptional regulator with XRE-family HTH domain
MSIIATNFKILRKIKNVSQEVAADELQIPRSRFASYEEGRAEPPYVMLVKIANYYQVSIDALLRGDFSKTDPDNLLKIGKNRFLFPILVDRKGNDYIEVVPLRASAGYLNGYADPEFIENLPVMTLPFSVSGKHRSFPIKGDSMPPANSGDFVVGKFVENLTDIKDGKTYVLLTKDEGIVYKRVYSKVFRGAGALELHSDNPQYQPYKVKPKDILEVWEYVCLLRTKDVKPDEINVDSMIGFLRQMKVEVKKETND